MSSKNNQNGTHRTVLQNRLVRIELRTEPIRTPLWRTKPNLGELDRIGAHRTELFQYLPCVVWNGYCVDDKYRSNIEPSIDL